MFERLGERLRAYANKDGRGYVDWAVRYMPVVRRLRGRLQAACRILEIGVNESGFARFAHVRTVVVDASLDALRAARSTQNVAVVAADVAALPFEDGVMDVCVCIDTFEHLRESDRDAAAGEIVRVLSDAGVGVVAFPSGEAAARAEEVIQSAYAQLDGGRIPWLEQHAAMGLPDAAALIDRFGQLSGTRYRVVCRKNATLWIWRWTWRILMCGWPGRGNAVFQALLRLAAPVLSRIHVGTCYRTEVWLEPRDGR
jgi:hypothetical protein